MKPTVLFIFGTRPEAIKLAPLIKVFSKPGIYTVKICVTAQHREMLDQVLHFFDLIPDYDLDLMRPAQSLFQITANSMTRLESVFNEAKPELVFVQGDTTTAFVGAMAAYYKNVPVAHIEAGLRTFDKKSPFPEEMNRQLITRLSDYHFAPTIQSQQNLMYEGVTKNVHVVGNTVIDALLLGLSTIEKDDDKYFQYFNDIDFSKKIILVTCHRRENFGEPFNDICKALVAIATAHKNIELVYPVHLNPNIREIAHQQLKSPNIKLIAPLEYPYLIWLMNKSHLILTDSGGIQEEAPTLGKPVLVLRNTSERTEGIEAGTAKLVGTNKQSIVDETELLLNDDASYNLMARSVNPYGDGTTSEKIFEIITNDLQRHHASLRSVLQKMS